MSMATALPGKLKKKFRKGGKTKTNDKTVNPVGDATAHDETEKKPSSRLPLSDKKSQGQLNQSSCNTEKNSNKFLERGKMAPKMSHSLDHPCSPDCLLVPPYPNNQSLEVKSSKGSQQTGTPGSSAISAVGCAESSVGVGDSLDTQEFTLPGNTASVADEPENMVNRASGTLGTSAGNVPLQSNQEASDAPAFGQPPNPINSDLVTSSVSAPSNMSLQVDQTGSNHSNPLQQPNASNSDISTNRVSASHTLSQADQTSAAISSATRGSETPEGAASGTDGSNVSQQQNASSSAVSPGEDEEHHQSLTPSSVQVEPEGEVEHSTSDEGSPQEEEGVNNYETLKVSEKIAEHKFLQDKLALHLDHTSHRVIKGWEDLACTREINAPLEVRLRCKLSSQNSCTMMLFDVVAAEGNKTLKDLIDALAEIKRNDVKKIITDVYPDAASSTQDLNEFATKTVNSNILAKMATLLDQKSRVNQYWLHLGHQFNLSGERLKELEYGQYTQVIMAYLYSAKSGLTIGTFYDEVKKLKRQDVLKKLDPFIVVEGDRNKRMEDVIGLDSDAMAGICVCLNNPNKVLKNWRHLAKSPVLGIPDEVLRDCTPETPKSPTESLFEWIYGERGSLTIGQLCRALERIDRNDVVRDIKECFQQQPTSNQ